MEHLTKALTGALVLMTLATGLSGCGPAQSGGAPEATTRTITNASYDPTREFYAAYNALFAGHYERETGVTVEVTQSHGGSGSQALAVAQGLPADVVTLALADDIAQVERAGLIDPGWEGELPRDSAPYTSTIVLLTRAGNPKGIRDWGDLAREGVGVITPNPKTSGGARWNFLAAWAWAEAQFGGDERQIEAFMKRLYDNVLVLDAGARGSTTSFVDNGQGDVLIAWENEAHLTLKQHPGAYEMVSPSVSILCQPAVAVVDGVARSRGSAAVAKAYLEYLYSDEAQRLAAEHFYRPSDEAILAAYKDKFDLNLQMTTIAHFGGWQAAQARFFVDGGAFDRIYERQAGA
ncbi:MAG: sulfate ABC transporter substrate-binding protein [Christensenellaceae bacterium]|nr:sulfate ABC transporter substrate-binding protein [Christensenellaceae bacterium]